ncbi:Stress response protein SCP2 [Williamsia sterculiae]|uniref:Stress response protein SCP2 n=2 Tax=Williamsia sterculiae TaxID=1344003 RepID=A0A1N7D1X0_9NOCA|nr:Stress response protein SCP2 [Williamsia sterculiae]
MVELRDLRMSSVSVHLQTWPAPVYPVIAPPPPIPESAVRADMNAIRLRGVGRFARNERAAARVAAEHDAAAYVQTETQRIEGVRSRLVAEVDDWWRALHDNDEATVIETVNTAFADNPAAGCAVGVDGRVLSVVMRQQDLDSLPQQTIGPDRSGQPTLKALPKREAMGWWLHILASNLVASVREALAVAPGITAVTAAVITRVSSDGRLGVVAFGTWTRDEVETTQWSDRNDALKIFDMGRDVQCSVNVTAAGNYSTTLKPLRLNRLPQLSELIDAAEDLGDSAADGPEAVDDHLASSPTHTPGPAQVDDPFTLTPIPLWLRDYYSAEHSAVDSPPPSPAPEAGRSHIVLTPGQNVRLPEPASDRVEVVVSAAGQVDTDLCVLLVNAAGQVRSDRDFVFYNQPVEPDGVAVLMGKARQELRTVERAVLRPVAAPTDVARSLLVTAIDSDELGSLAETRLEVRVSCSGIEWKFTPRNEPFRAMILGEVYRHAGDWKLRALGQGWADGLAGLARDHGVDVED